MKERQIHLGDSKYNGTKYTRADFEAFLVSFYRVVLPLKKRKNHELDPQFSKARQALNILCEGCCGREIERADEMPLAGGLTNPINWPNTDWSLFQAITAVDNFRNWFNLSKDENPDGCHQVLMLIEVLKWVVEYFELGREVKVYWPEKTSGNAMFVGEHLSNEIFLPLSDIIDKSALRQNRLVKNIVSEEISKLYSEAEKMFGFGVAWCIFFDAFPGQTASDPSLKQWQEIYRAAPPGSEMSAVAWNNLELEARKLQKT